MKWLGLAAIGLFCRAGAAVGQSGLPNDDLVGLWGSEAVFGPQVRGELTLERSGRGWTARIAGFEQAFSANGDSVRFRLAGGQGEFLGKLGRAGKPLLGFWIQPPGPSYAFVTPVTLTPITMTTWRGQVRPLEERFSLYLKVDRQPDGTLRGSFHNPESRWNGRAAWFTVNRDGDHVTFTDPATGRVRFRQAYDSAQRTIDFNFGAPFALTPRTADQAVGFYPRPASAGPLAYRVPVARGDGIRTGTAASVGVDPLRLVALLERITSVDPSGDRVPRVHGVLVARRGVLVLEEYFFGFGPDRPHDTRSAAKTLTSIMIGASMTRGTRLDATTPMASLIPSPVVRTSAPITLGHLLTHSSGLACDDNDDASPGNEERMQSQRSELDWIRFAAGLPSVAEPGSRYAYCSAGINLAAGMLARATNRWLPELFDTEIARPLGFGDYHWNLTPTGDGYGGGGAYIRPRDLLKIGLLYLGNGAWNGRQIVSKRWVEQSTGFQIKISDQTSDGFAWHRFELDVGGRRYQEYEASGNGGQLVIVVPALELVVVFTAGNYNQYPVWRTFRDELVPRYVIDGIRAQ